MWAVACLHARTVIGAVPSPFDCYLALRGLKTMSYRMKGHMSNAFKVAKYLERHSMVEKVLYPGKMAKLLPIIEHVNISGQQ